MSKEKIAILTDSCCDVPKDLAERYHIFVLPMKIVYRDREYLDGVEISPQEVYGHLAEEIPTTSLPSGAMIHQVFDQIKSEGYDKVIAVTLSSELSGTNNLLHLMAQDENDLEIYILDTKNIAIASGFHAIQAARYREAGYDFATICQKLEQDVPRSKVFFVVETLEYLQKGGRIGLVASLFGNALNLKPVISCNEKGIYYTVAKVRGRKQSIRRTMDLALKFAQGHKRINLAVCHGGCEVTVKEVEAYMKEQLPDHELYVSGQISPSLGVHTGPGLIGIGIEILDD